MKHFQLRKKLKTRQQPNHVVTYFVERYFHDIALGFASCSIMKKTFYNVHIKHSNYVCKRTQKILFQKIRTTVNLSIIMEASNLFLIANYTQINYPFNDFPMTHLFLHLIHKSNFNYFFLFPPFFEQFKFSKNVLYGNKGLVIARFYAF